MKKWIYSGVFTALVLALMMPGLVLAAPLASSSGQSSILYNSILFSRTDLSWLDPADPTIDTRGSLSGVNPTMGGVQDPYNAMVVDGAPWGDTSTTATAHLSDVNNNATGSASTNVTNPANPALSASANVTMTSATISTVTPPGISPTILPFNSIGSVDIAQGVFSGQFTVPTDGLLTVTASYQLTQTLLNTLGAFFSSSEVAAGLALYDFWTTDPITGQSLLLASNVQFLSNMITGPGSLTLGQSGILTLTFNLIALDAFGAPIVYDFEAFASTKGAAAITGVPEPLSLILLGGGLVGLATFRKRLA